jgi:hypothetical protein
MSNSVPRQRLPNRRSHWLYGGQFYTGGIGRFDDGRIAEIFINGPKVGSAAEANAQDAAIVTSLALQYGCPPGNHSPRPGPVRWWGWPFGHVVG